MRIEFRLHCPFPRFEAAVVSLNLEHGRLIVLKSESFSCLVEGLRKLICLTLVVAPVENAPFFEGFLSKHLLLDVAIEVVSIAVCAELVSAHDDVARWELLAIDLDGVRVDCDLPVIKQLLDFLLIHHF